MRRYLGLRLQIVVAFVISAFLLSLLLSLIAYTLTRSNLLDRREQAAVATAVKNANIVNRRIANLRDGEGPEAVMQGIATLDKPALIRFPPSYWISSGDIDEFNEGDIDQDLSLIKDIRVGEARVMRYRRGDSVAESPPSPVAEDETEVDQEPADAEAAGSDSDASEESEGDAGAPTSGAEGSDAASTGDSDSASDAEGSGDSDEVLLTVSIPLPEAAPQALYEAAPQTLYFESSSLQDVSETLQSLALVLAGATALTTLAGAGLGYYVARVTMKPLREITDAAENISGGDMSTRLDDQVDPDLASLAHSFNQMTTNLEERIERDARFASDVSHELRSPLMTLTASASVLRGRKDNFDERSQVAIDLMSTEIDRFKQLVEDLLEISRFDVGAVSLETSTVAPGEFVRQALAFSGADPDLVEVTPEAQDLAVSVDKRRMGQVIRNLIENAANYAGGITDVVVSADQKGEVAIAIGDRGPGIPESERSAIFDRFFRGVEGGRRGSGTGSGLGLSLVREHVRLHGGAIEVSDRDDDETGSRFVIRLPAHQRSPEDEDWDLA